MKYIATTDLPGLGIRKGEIVEMDKPSPGLSPITRIVKDRSRPPSPKQEQGWGIVANILTFLVSKFLSPRRHA